MNDDFFDAVYNPDVLSCIANLSSDEVFTPPGIANDVLDMLPQELFQSRDTTFLDPGSKSGIFLREIAKRLLRAQIPGYERIAREIRQKQREGGTLDPDEESFLEVLQENIDHIFHNQLFGIAVTELTSLLSRRSVYCSKFPNSEFSISHFDSAEGNIRFRRTQHIWDKNGSCKYCGASKELYDRGDKLETHAYEFIHTKKPEDIFSMKFDVIISNPPYAQDTAGAGRQAKPLYNLFVEQAKKLHPRYLCMIIPSRWFSGGMGLDDFRKSMISDAHITKMVDFTNSKDCFPGVSVSGGVSYFLWERDKTSECEFTNITNGETNVMVRPLNEFSTLVRYNSAVSIIHKVNALTKEKLETIISSLMPYGLSTSYRGRALKTERSQLTLYASNGVTYINRNEITKGLETVDKYKILVSKTSAEHAGEPGNDGKFKVIPSSMKVIGPGDVCTHSYFIIGNWDSESPAKNALSYMRTKFVRFLMLLCISGFGLSKIVFPFVPMQDFSKPWTDKELYAKYGLTDKEIEFIESMIKPMDGADEDVEP